MKDHGHCIVTGGTTGIGLAVARRLAEAGAAVTIVGHDRERGAAAKAAIDRAVGEERAEFLLADLSDQDQVRRLAATLMERHPRIAVLINNAGGLFGHRRVSAQGLEMTFALNHLSYFLLSLLLLPALRAAAPARIVNVASGAHRGVQLDFDDLQAERNYRPITAYRRSKLANLLFTRALARRLNPAEISVNALHPGFVATDLGTRNAFLPAFLWKLATRFAISPERGADTPVYLATAPEAAGFHGEYFYRCRPSEPSPAARDDQAAARLWQESLRLTGLSEAELNL
ncbi:SDR family NAD(P)-dependent oxidoreductase [Candidatus Methylocalor cossyra]|uniref:Short-chain dehydrogenase n=1 Tax=Candidatus Methylocalor cossyra TaxID=3108543 RepID=A0ABP1CCA6_9GAMM